MSAHWRASWWMVGCVVGLSSMALSVRWLSGDLTVAQMLFLRSAVGLPLVVIALLLAQGRAGFAQLRMRHLKLHMLRNGIHLVAQGLWMASILLLPLATVFAIEFSAPIFSILLGALLFGEFPRKRQIIGIVLGLFGILVIVRPWSHGVEPGVIIVLLAALGFAGNFIATRALGLRETSWSILFWMCLIQSPFALLPAIVFWEPLKAAHIPLLLSLAGSGLFAHYCLANALRLAPVAHVVTLDYLRLPLIAIAGALLFDESVNPFALLGGAIVLVAVAASQTKAEGDP